MPCYKCNNGKYKYGKRGRCQFDTLEKCRAAEAAIHARKPQKSLEDTCDSCDNPDWSQNYDKDFELDPKLLQ